MELFLVDTIEEARVKMLAAFSGRERRTQVLDFQQACGFVLAEDIYAAEDLPGFDRSTVDGYAVRAADTAGAGESIPSFLRCVGAVDMGQTAQVLIQAGECAYVPTGGMIPDGADSVVMVEYCERFAGDGGIAVYESVSPGRNLIRKGDDAKDGQLLLRRGTVLRPPEIGVLAAAGITQVTVCKALSMTIISTGDELVPPGQIPQAGQIRDLNTAALHAQAECAGFNVQRTLVVRDEEMLLSGAVREAIRGNDIVVISGGSSQGERDLTAQVIKQFSVSGLLTHGLAMKPGKPTIVAYSEENDCLLIGLPGHPVSAMLVFETLLGWLWRTISGQKPPYPVEAVMLQNVPGDPGKDTLQLVRLRQTDLYYEAIPVLGKSGLITRLSQADGYIVIDRNKEGITKGEAVQVHFL